jgi:hypothetical protein
MGLIDFSLKDIGSVFKDIREAITGKAIEDPQKQAELLLKLQQLELEYTKMKANIVNSEAKSEHWLTSTWRPITMLVFVFIIFNNYVLVPYAQAFGANIPTLNLTPEMWELLKIGIGGYIIGRSAEKVADKLKSKL